MGSSASARSRLGSQQLCGGVRHPGLVEPLEGYAPGFIIMHIVLRGRAQVGRVVVGDEQVRDELAPRARVGLRKPAPDYGAAVTARRTLQLLLLRCGLPPRTPVLFDPNTPTRTPT